MFKKLKVRYRLYIQIVFGAFTNSYVQGFAAGKLYTGPSKQFCVPGLNCYSCPGALGSCPIGALQSVTGSRDYQFSFYVVGCLLAFGMLLGRWICGFLCPFGLVQDLLYKIPLPKRFKRKNLPGDRYLRGLKYGMLFGLVLLLPLLVVDVVGQGAPAFCKWVCPSGTLMAGIPLIASNPSLQQSLGWLFALKLFLLVLTLLLSVAAYRPFCKYLCPLGVVYGACNPVSLYRFSVDPNKCVRCGVCQKVCKMDVVVYEKPNSPACIRCGDCKRACPHGAIRSGWGFKEKGAKDACALHRRRNMI
jgi:ferredoxin-type protein NapH